MNEQHMTDAFSQAIARIEQLQLPTPSDRLSTAIEQVHALLEAHMQAHLSHALATMQAMLDASMPDVGDALERIQRMLSAI